MEINQLYYYWSKGSVCLNVSFTVDLTFLPLNLSGPFLSPRYVLEASNRGRGGQRERGSEREQWGQQRKNSIV